MVLQHNYTVNLEYMAPNNRIVLNYPEPKLTILSVRSNHDGSYLSFYNNNNNETTTTCSIPPPPQQFLARNLVLDMMDDNDNERTWNEKKMRAFLGSIPDQRNLEGYVVILASGQRVKIKTKWYLGLHLNTKGGLSDSAIAQAVVNATMDEVRAQNTPIHRNPLERIDAIANEVTAAYGAMIDTSVETFYETNKTLSPS